MLGALLEILFWIFYVVMGAVVLFYWIGALFF